MATATVATPALGVLCEQLVRMMAATEDQEERSRLAQTLISSAMPASTINVVRGSERQCELSDMTDGLASGHKKKDSAHRTTVTGGDTVSCPRALIVTVILDTLYNGAVPQNLL